jgi:hypothetical protein
VRFDLSALVTELAISHVRLASEQQRTITLRGSRRCKIRADIAYVSQFIHAALRDALENGHGEIRVDFLPTKVLALVAISTRLREGNPELSSVAVSAWAPDGMGASVTTDCGNLRAVLSIPFGSARN